MARGSTRLPTRTALPCRPRKLLHISGGAFIEVLPSGKAHENHREGAFNCQVAALHFQETRRAALTANPELFIRTNLVVRAPAKMSYRTLATYPTAIAADAQAIGAKVGVREARQTQDYRRGPEGDGGSGQAEVGGGQSKGGGSRKKEERRIQIVSTSSARVTAIPELLGYDFLEEFYAQEDRSFE